MSNWATAKAMCTRSPRNARYNLKKQFFVGFQSHETYVHRVKKSSLLLRYTLTLVIEGGGTYSDESDCATKLYPGLVLLRPPNILYDIRRDLVKGKSREFVLNLPETIYRALLDMEIVPVKTVAAKLVLSDALYERTSNLIESLASVNDYNFAPWMIDVIRYLDHINDLIKGSEDDANKRLLRKACKELESNPEEIISIRDIASNLGISARTLRNIFHSNLGVSPKDYRLHYIFEYAARMLVYTQASIKEIAYRTGYANAQGFCRQFRRIMGSSPGEYRKKHSDSAKS